MPDPSADGLRFARKLLNSALTDGNPEVARALALLLNSIARAGTDSDLTSFDELVRAVLRARPAASGTLAQLVEALKKDPKLAARLAELLTDLGDQLRENLDEYSLEKLLEKLKESSRFDELVEEAAGRTREAAAADHQPDGQPAAGAAPEQPKPAAKPDGVSVELPGGITVTFPQPKAPGETLTKPPEGEIPSAGPPTIYGEDLAVLDELYAIAIHTVTCEETTDYTGVGIITFGIAGIVGVDDEIAHLVRGVAKFRQADVPVRFTSEVHDDVSNGETLSDLPQLVVPQTESDTHLYSREETHIANRFPFRGNVSLGQDRLISAMYPFKLDDFLFFQGDMVLLEDDNDIKKIIAELMGLLQELANTASTALSAVSFGQSTIVTQILNSITKNELFTKINDLIQALISSQARIGLWPNMHFSQRQIRAAFQQGPVLKHPPNADPPNFEYVTDRAEQTFTFRGLGAVYHAKVRYERYKPRA